MPCKQKVTCEAQGKAHAWHWGADECTGSAKAAHPARLLQVPSLSESTEYMLQTMHRSWPSQASATLLGQTNSVSKQSVTLVILADVGFNELSDPNDACNAGRAFGPTTGLSRGDE